MTRHIGLKAKEGWEKKKQDTWRLGARCWMVYGPIWTWGCHWFGFYVTLNKIETVQILKNISRLRAGHWWIGGQQLQIEDMVSGVGLLFFIFFLFGLAINYFFPHYLLRIIIREKNTEILNVWIRDTKLLNVLKKIFWPLFLNSKL